MIKRTEELNGYLSSKEAGDLLGYTHDYVSRLCRQGSIGGIRRGREWFVLPNELKEFKERHEVFLKEKKKELSKKFSKIRLEHEAKKRKAKEALNNKKESVVKKTVRQDKPKEVVSNEIPREKLSFRVPKELIAVVVLGLMVMIPGVSLSSKSTNNDSYIPKAEIAASLKDLSGSLDEGIQQTIYAQSAAVTPALELLASTQYIAEMYWNSMCTLPKEVYRSLVSIGRGYLVLYVYQGEAMYVSIGNLNSMGAVVLRGYEMIGESFVSGYKDIFQKYKNIFSIDSKIEKSGQMAEDLTSNVQGGLKYATSDSTKNLPSFFFSKCAELVGVFFENVKANCRAMNGAVSEASHVVGAYVGSLFELNIGDKNPEVRVTKL